MRNEQQAWRELAEAFANGTAGGTMGDQVWSLYRQHKITERVANRMDACIDEHGFGHLKHDCHTNDSRALACLWFALEAEEEARG